MNILVPTDFSENSNNAIEFAAEMSRSTTAGIVLLHVLHGSAPDVDRLVAREKLGVIVSTLETEYPGIQVSTSIATGEIVDAILVAAEEHHSNLIVMETEGATTFSRLFLGSKTAAVIENTDTAVLSLPPNYAFKKIRRVLYYTNFSKDDIKNAVDLVMIASLFQADVFITHVTVEPEMEETESTMVEAFANQVSSLTDYPRIKYIAQDDNTVPLGIDHVITEVQADLVAISTRKRSIVEKIYNPSVTKKLALYSDIPLLAFHFHDQ